MKICKIIISLSFIFGVHASAKISKTEVDWRKGGMDKALVEAKAAHKPLLVFWGAVWCPPCNALKAKAFHDPKFVAATRSFVAVYLDGDSDEAQTWGERFQASGYPTLLVLNPAGQEVQRVVTSDPLAAMIEELDRTREDLSPYDDLLLQASRAKTGKDLPSKTWQRLAARDWLNDERWHDRESELADQLERLASVFPKEMRVERERVVLQSMLARAATLNAKDSAKDKPDEVRRKEWLAHLEQVLENPGTVREQAGILSESAEVFTKVLFPKESVDATRDAFIARYLQAFRTYRQTEGLSAERRMYSLIPFAELSRGSNPLYPELKKDEAALMKKEVDQQLERAQTQEQIVIALDTLAEVYTAIGLIPDAAKIVTKQLDRLDAKNEMMSVVGELESKQGHKVEALKWRERAYREAQGGPTRLQWGVGYIRRLIEDQPKDVEKIEAETQLLVGDSLKRSDAFSGRSWRTLNRLTQFCKTGKNRKKSRSPRPRLYRVAPPARASARIQRRVHDARALSRTSSCWID